MKYLHLIVIVLFIGLVPNECHCQEVEPELIEYEFGYPFKTGIYRTFEDFLTNNPQPISHFRVITRAAIIMCRSGELCDYIEFESDNDKIRINASDIWGYSKRGKVYVVHDNMFHKIMIYGSICQLNSLRGGTKEDDEVRKPFNQANAELFALLDAKTGKTYDFKQKNFEILLSEDVELHEEYLNSKIKKKDKLYIFLNKYNKKHKIYFPAIND